MVGCMWRSENVCWQVLWKWMDDLRASMSPLNKWNHEVLVSLSTQCATCLTWQNSNRENSKLLQLSSLLLWTRIVFICGYSSFSYDNPVKSLQTLAHMRHLVFAKKAPKAEILIKRFRLKSTRERELRGVESPWRDTFGKKLKRKYLTAIPLFQKFYEFKARITCVTQYSTKCV